MAELKEARVPDIGGYDDVPVIEVLVAVGDTVKADQGLVTLESDKATMEVPAPFAGVVRELKVKVGDTLSEGGVVALLEADAGAAETQPARQEAAQPPQPARARQMRDQMQFARLHAEVLAPPVGPGDGLTVQRGDRRVEGLEHRQR